jgi:hypothetical protein
VQRPVAALGEHFVRLHHDDRVVVLDGDLDVVEVVLFEQRRFPDRRLDQALTPIRIDTPASAAALAIAPTWSSNLRMFPGLTRTPAHPASIAAKTYLGWKWMSAMTGICDFLAIAGSASASSALGQATRTMSQPVAVSSAIC